MPVNIKTNIIKYKDPETNQFVGISAAGMTPDNLNLTSSVEPTSTASEQHTVGSYFLYNSNLYKATSTINPGETIAPGTNCERAYLSDIAAIKFDQTQNLTEEQKVQAQENIGADEMTVGHAEQLVSTVGIEDSVPYLLRTTGGSADIGDRVKLSEITGGTVAWNQLVENGNFATDSANWKRMSIASYAVANNTYTFTANAYRGSVHSAVALISAHKYLISADIKLTTASTLIRFGLLINNANAWAGAQFTSATTSKQRLTSIATATITTNDNRICVRDERNSDWDAVELSNIVCIDLTQAFGSTIADYLYALETSTAGAGIAQLKAWGFCTKPYYAYDAGSLQSVETTAHREVGFNQWDEEWENGYFDTTTGAEVAGTSTIRAKNYVPIVPNTAYFFHNGGTDVFVCVVFYDASENVIEVRSGPSGNIFNGKTFTTPNNAAYLRFYMSSQYGSTYGNNICINLHWDGERDGEYEPYEEHTYPLDDVELRGIPKLDANNNLYYDGDTYASDGTVTRKYGIVDLGTLGNWSEYSGYPGLFYLNVTPSGAKIPASNTVLPSLIANGYIAGISRDIGTSGHTKGEIALAANRIYISNDTYAGNASGFRTAISGVYLVYELATPTTEEADPYQETQICNDFGIEEFVDTRTVPIPVGYTALYQPNLRAKLEMAPDSPSDGDGDYIVRQTNGENAYVKLTLPMASDAQVKAGTDTSTLLTPSKEAAAAFYGLAKAAGDATQASSSNAVGTYTSGAKTAIKAMLGVESGVTGVTVNGTSVVTNGVAAIPKASSSVFGVVNPDAKTSAMTQAVGVDSNGKLYTEPGSGGGSSDIHFVDFTYNSSTKQITTTDTISNIWSQVATSGKQAIARFTTDTWGPDDRDGKERVPLFTIYYTTGGWYDYNVEFVNDRWRIVGQHNWDTDVDSWKIVFTSQNIKSESIAYYIEEIEGPEDDIYQGDLFVLNGKLYVATQTITGYTATTDIVVGTNCEATTIANEFIRKPAYPEEDGTYHLKLVVDGGEPTLSWEEEPVE